MTRYASETKVSSAQSRAEIEHTLSRYGADGFMYGYQGERAIVAFRMKERQIRFILTLPDKADEEFHIYMRGSTRYQRERHVAEGLWEKACRQRWRALALVIKAKLEAVECGISELEDEFLANIVLPDGSTVGDRAKESIAIAYASGTMPPMLPDFSGGK